MDRGISPELLAVLVRSRELGFLGPISLERQVEHANGFADALEKGGIAQPTRIIDLGSGGGLPGLILAGRWSQASFCLLDGSVRRCEFLEEACDELGFADRASVSVGRAEDLAHDKALRGWADLVVARSFGPPPAVAECAAGLLSVGGFLLVSEPPNEIDVSVRWPQDGLRQLGLGMAQTLVSGAHYALMQLESPCPERFPRRVGVPVKRPLF